MGTRKLTPREKAEKRRRKEEFMTIFINGKQKRVRRPQTIDGMDPDEFILRNADPIWLHENGMWWLLDQLYCPKPVARVDDNGLVIALDEHEGDDEEPSWPDEEELWAMDPEVGDAEPPWLEEEGMWEPIYEAAHAEPMVTVDDGWRTLVDEDGGDEIPF